MYLFMYILDTNGVHRFKITLKQKLLPCVKHNFNNYFILLLERHTGKRSLKACNIVSVRKLTFFLGSHENPFV